MTDLGVKSPNLSKASVLDDVLGNRAGSSRRLTIIDLAKQLAGTSPINLLGNQAPLYATYADLVAATIATKVSAWVYEDPDPAKNGIYGWMSNTWTWVLPLPYSFIDATDAGAGTANAIKATSDIPVSEAALISVEIFRNTTDVPVTISFNDGPALTIKTITNTEQLALTGGMLVWGKIYGSDFRLTVDQDVSALVAQAEVKAAAAAASAQDAQNSETAAANYAASINPASFVPKTWVTRNVLQHGAYIDGTNAAATSVAFQAAYDAASEGDTIVVPVGNYNFSVGVTSSGKAVTWHVFGNLLLSAYNWSDILPGTVVSEGRRDFKNGVPKPIAKRNDVKGMGLVTSDSVDYFADDIADDVQSSEGRVQGRVTYMRVKAGAIGIRQTSVGQCIVEGTPGATPGGGYFVGTQGFSATIAPSTNYDSIHASNFYAEAFSGATGWKNVTGGETNVFMHTGSQADYRSGWQIAGGGQVRGSVTDAGLVISNLAVSDGCRFKNGILFGNANGDYALASDGTVMKVEEATIANVIDIGTTTITGSYLKGPNINIAASSAHFAAPSQTLALGAPSQVSTVAQRIYTSGHNLSSPDVTIAFSGGTTTLNQGTMAITAGEVATNCVIRPTTDNAYSLGGANFRWSAVWSATATISTSDENYKENIKPVDEDRAISLLKAVEPITFVWKDDETQATTRIVKGKRQKVEKIVEEKAVEKIDVIDGKAILRTVMEVVERDEPVFNELPVVDENNAPVTRKVRVIVGSRPKVVTLKLNDGSLVKETILMPNGEPAIEPIWELQDQPLIHRVPVMEDFEEVIEVASAYHKKNTRTHWGFSAQQVEAAIGAVGLTSQEFAGLIIDEETGIYGLRDAQFTPILWRALQAALTRIEALEAKCGVLTNSG
ncbi:tail fiber domain-containing protein [Agrobacterium vitis]|uniref:tail fiber domain-containing protein n=1 Tax=Agrobacterium vitis TaxID=373 RepID=UPI001572B684|nr:tail fiber domain-containing protein [Agrobacterium vitis]NSZ48438.1 tail fiber domain-containing protein [Agrobacterium vitis]UJL73034.1 tail fiber domain-containing protein [Agrobacterium vitis]